MASYMNFSDFCWYLLNKNKNVKKNKKMQSQNRDSASSGPSNKSESIWNKALYFKNNQRVVPDWWSSL